ncbi:MAG: orotidine-5'-phosphate decarboxylase [Thermoplasmata archaeon]
MEKNIIVALDLESEIEAIKIARLLKDEVYAFKVGYPLILNNGLQVLTKIASIANVIVDIKIADIPDVSQAIAKKISSYGVKGIIMQGFVGSDTMKAVREVSRELYVVAEMSHEGSLQFITPASEKIALLAKEVGADGLVAPATRPERIKVIKNIANLPILSPGVGTQGGSYSEAMKNGADYVIIGRSIILSPDPLQKIKEFYNGVIK